jgi:hypothetical protein
MSGIGHNKGPAMDAGVTYRTFQWRHAQRAMMPKALPLMIIKMRVKRARELGMDYQTYAKVRQAAGHDILALMFSSNALRIIGPGARMPDAETRALEAVSSARKLALVHAPNMPSSVLQANPVLDAADIAPKFTDKWADIRHRLTGFLGDQKLPFDKVLIIGDAPLEADWSVAARAAGYLPSVRYFAHQM